MAGTLRWINRGTLLSQIYFSCKDGDHIDVFLKVLSEIAKLDYDFVSIMGVISMVA